MKIIFVRHSETGVNETKIPYDLDDSKHNR